MCLIFIIYINNYFWGYEIIEYSFCFKVVYRIIRVEGNLYGVGMIVEKGVIVIICGSVRVFIGYWFYVY